MNRRHETVEIRLKVPDNAAYTALVALQHLGIDVARVEHAVVWGLTDDGDPATLVARIERNQALFNPNLHAVSIRSQSRPETAEIWIWEVDHDAWRLPGRGIEGVTSAKPMASWRLFQRDGRPASEETLRRACNELLRNAAVEDALFRSSYLT